eukprot:785511-Alexandrium_andersonii.AAC.1
MLAYFRIPLGGQQNSGTHTCRTCRLSNIGEQLVPPPRGEPGRPPEIATVSAVNLSVNLCGRSRYNSGSWTVRQLRGPRTHRRGRRSNVAETCRRANCRATIAVARRTKRWVKAALA